MKFEEIQLKANREWEKFANPTRPRILLGAATCGRASGVSSVREKIEDELKSKNIDAAVYEVGCLGMCFCEPLIEIGLQDNRRVLYKEVTPELVPELIESFIVKGDPRPDLALCTFGDVAMDGIPKFEDLPMIKRQVRVVLRNSGIIDPTNIYHYIARGGYSGLARALSIPADAVIEEVTKSGIRGRGGAGFPTGVKWGFAAKEKADRKYMICNADEGDPGAFMDRAALEGDPHAVLEGLVIAAYAIGADTGIIYCRAEYPLAIERLEIAIRQMEELGLAGNNVMGSNFNLEIKIKKGAGAFVCGEETALMASIEGNRGMPKTRPPFPAQSGLFKKPTIINNVETLANISEILRLGADWFAQYGTEKSKGTKTFALAGKINRTGLIEVPMGITLHEIIFDIGGGVLNNGKFKAVQTGGPSGGSISKENLHLKVDYDELAKAGSIMGSGGMIVMDEETCIVDIARYFLDFTQKESCGKCVPCRMGTKIMLEILEDICNGRGKESDISTLLELAESIRIGSLCGLGQTAPNPVLTTIKYFRREYESHIHEKRCLAAACGALFKAPCSHTCPVGLDVAGYVALISEGRFDEAYELIMEKNPLPGVCGRVCTHPCEAKCLRRQIDEPIAIKTLKRFVTDYVGKRKNNMSPPPSPSGDPVAVVGSGPAGLTAAYFLARKGHPVVVFEKLPVAGGMLAVGIPSFRLPRDVLAEEIEIIKSYGVEIRTEVEIGKDVTIDNLLEQGFKAVFIGVGFQLSMRLGIPGENLKGVYPGLELLRDHSLGKKIEAGERVGVIGGGNTAIDAARTLLRSGSKTVYLIYRRTREEMPAAEEEISEAFQEGIIPLFLTAPVSIAGEEGKVKELVCMKMELGEVDSSGRRRPVPVEGSEFRLAVDMVVPAIGQASDIDGIAGGNSKIDAYKGFIRVDPYTMATSRPGVFAGGDVINEEATVVWAMRTGVKAALEIDKFLGGDGKPIEKVRKAANISGIPLKQDENLILKHRVCQNMLPEESRSGSFDEVELGFDKETAVEEAKRCLRCDYGKYEDDQHGV